MSMAPTTLRLGFFLISFCSSVFAAPKLRLEDTGVYQQVAVGAVVSSRTLRAFNIGDGSLSLNVSVPPEIAWLAASIGPPQACALSSTPCIPLQFSLTPA